eukprot:scaffold5412_cov171-Ochromonas_danica.AAC.1
MVDEVKGSIAEKLKEMLAAVEKPVTPFTATATPSTPIPAVTKSKTGPELFDEMFESLQVADSAVAQVIDEVSRYLSIPKLPTTQLHELKPLLW